MGKTLIFQPATPPEKRFAAARVPIQSDRILGMLPWSFGNVLALGLGRAEKGVTNMLETIAIILLILWALGLVSSYTIGGFIHLLLVVAVIVIIIRVIQGRRL